MRHIISLLLENEPGALSRVAGLFSARAYNIESLSVAPTEDETVSRMTLVNLRLGRDHRADHQATEQAHRRGQAPGHHRGCACRTRDHAGQGAGGRGAREEVKRLADIFRGHILDVTLSTYIIEITGDGAKLDAFLDTLDQRSIIEVVRSGSLAIGRGEKGLRL